MSASAVQGGHKNLPSAHHCTTLWGCIYATKVCIDNRRKKLVKQQYLLHMFSQYGEHRRRLVWVVCQFGALQQISTGFECWLRHCTDVAQQRSTKLCTMSCADSLAHYMYISGGSCPQRNFSTCKIRFASKSCVLLYLQRYCTARE